MYRIPACIFATAIVLLSLAFAGAAAAAEDTGLAGEPPDAPRLAVDAFLKDLAAGKYDEAYARTTPEYQKTHPKDKWKQGFTKMGGTADLSKLKLVEMHATEPTATREARAAGITDLLDTEKKNRKLGFGFGLVRQKDKWLIRDIDVLPNANAQYNFITRFREVEPNAKEVPAGPEDQPRPVPRN
jgi:hypothetical protein